MYSIFAFFTRTRITQDNKDESHDDIIISRR